MKTDCFKCVGYLFFKPLSDETFSCCDSYGETDADINLKTGVSPAIQKHKIEKVPCEKFKKGKSHCWPPKKRPFSLGEIREKGEENLLKRMST